MTETELAEYDHFDVYIDGGCVPNPGKGAWAAILTNGGKEITRLCGRDAMTTNNKMEMTAAISALEHLEAMPGIILTFITDSQLLQQGMTEWLPKWKEKNWKAASGKPVKNKDFWERLDALTAARSGAVSWVWVRGHDGNHWNEEADRLANASINPDNDEQSEQAA